MNSGNTKRSIVRNGQKTSVSLEEEFWEGLREIANSQKTKLTKLVRQIDQGRAGSNLSSAIRVFVFNQLRAQVSGASRRHARSAGHRATGRGIRFQLLSGGPQPVQRGSWHCGPAAASVAFVRERERRLADTVLRAAGARRRAAAPAGISPRRQPPSR